MTQAPGALEGSCAGSEQADLAERSGQIEFGVSFVEGTYFVFVVFLFFLHLFLRKTKRTLTRSMLQRYERPHFGHWGRISGSNANLQERRVNDRETQRDVSLDGFENHERAACGPAPRDFGTAWSRLRPRASFFLTRLLFAGTQLVQTEEKQNNKNGVPLFCRVPNREYPENNSFKPWLYFFRVPPFCGF